ncbi:MAG: DNA (cytosine-5-)-methyltransferase [Flavobacterium sp.]|nr:DNA (cytosine-5-)-methyltransferase [Flavobacterium sp.]
MGKKFTVGSLFAGIGGICKAFENARTKLIWANEIDNNACITYRTNFTHKLYEDDIHNLADDKNIKKLEKVDIIVGGFPCQAFSIAGYRKGFADPRGNLFFETAKIIDEIKPKAFMLENVKNLVSHDKGKTFNTIKNVIINDLKYSFIPFVLNSKDYGNIPQTRERIYIVGFKDEYMFNNFEDIFEYYTIQGEELYRKMVNNRNNKNSLTMNFNVPKPINLTKNIHDLIDKEKQDISSYYLPNNRYYETFKNEIKSKDSIYQWRRIYVRENKSNVCPTLTANMGTGGHNVPIIKDDYGIRKLTLSECLRFQGFDDGYNLPKIAKTQLYKQIGNSVTIPVVERVAKEIVRTLNLNLEG